MRLVILQIELAVCASLLNFVLLALESGPLYLFFVSYFIIIIIIIIIIIYLFIYLLCMCSATEKPRGIGTLWISCK